MFSIESLLSAFVGGNRDYFFGMDGWNRIIDRFDEPQKKQLIRDMKENVRSRRKNSRNHGDYIFPRYDTCYTMILLEFLFSQTDHMMSDFDKLSKKKKLKIISKLENEDVSDLAGQDYSDAAAGDHCTYECSGWPYSNCKVISI